MRRIGAVILLVVVHAGLGTGLVGHLHAHAHAAEDAAAAEQRRQRGLPPEPAPHHDESNCTFHALLAQPIAWQGAPPCLPLVRPRAEAVAARQERVVAHRVPRRVDCRGPPLL